MSADTQVKPNTKQALDLLQRDVESIIAPLGYEVVALDQSSGGSRRIILYIDFLNNTDGSRRIGLDDCVTVNKAVDELFETTPLIEGHYTLEVSSPGVERPLRKPEDFARFSGKKARIHTFRPLEREEAENPNYWEKNKRQKNFVGRLEGMADGKIQISVDGQLVKVPMALVSKAHLEIDFEVLDADLGEEEKKSMNPGHRRQRAIQ